MAKKVPRKKASGSRKRAAEPVILSTKDKRTLKSLRGVADGLVETAQRKRAPHLDIPSRSLSNVRYNKTKRFIEMGAARTAASCSICRKPRATCRPCWSVADVSG